VNPAEAAARRWRQLRTLPPAEARAAAGLGVLLGAWRREAPPPLLADLFPDPVLVAAEPQAVDATLAQAAEDLAGLEVVEDHLLPRRRARRGAGAYYTPAWLVAHLTEAVLTPLPTGARVLDPACGAGAFLLAAADRVGPAGLRGVDRDPLAVAAARLALLDLGLSPWQAAAAVTVGDGLLDLSLTGVFDAVLGNPPWGLKFSPAERRALTTAGLADPGELCSAALFLRAARRQARPGGRVGLVLPEGWLSTRRAAGLRRELLAEAAIETIEVYRKGVFPAAPDMLPTVVVLGREPTEVRLLGLDAPLPSGPPAWRSVRRVAARAWAAEPESVFAVAETEAEAAWWAARRDRCARLDSVVSLHDGLYKTHLTPLLGNVGAPMPGNAGAPVLTLGRHLRPYHLADPADLPRLDPARATPEARRQLAPKLLAHALRKPALAQRVVVAVDERGEYHASNNFLLLLPRSDCPWDLAALAALLNSRRLNAWYAARFIQVNIEAFTLGAVPLPAFEAGCNQRLAALGRAGAVGAETDAAVDRAFG
jgi:predicted RNA methylase